jgi:transglutaminase-like putative cysteine protease/GT2 family glycosyltransferase
MSTPFGIVIPAKNLRGALPLVLRCLERQTLPLDRFECIVVDDGSTDGMSEWLATYRAPFALEVVRMPHSVGRSLARNAGCARTTAEFLVFLDGDMLPAPGWLAGYARAREASGCDVLSGARACLTLDPQHPHLAHMLAELTGAAHAGALFADDAAAAQFEALQQHAVLGQYPIPAYARLERELRAVCLHCPDSLIGAYACVTSNVAVRRARFEQTRGFDAFLPRIHDTDLGMTLWEHGARTGFAQEARACHLYAAQPDRGLDPQESIAFFYRHPYRLVAQVYHWFAAQQGQATRVPASTSLVDLARGDMEADAASPQGFGAAAGRGFTPAMPADCRYDRDDITAYCAEHFAVPPALTSTYLDRALQRGLIVREERGVVTFDIHHTLNWMRYHTPFQEQILRRSSFTRQQTRLFDSSRGPEARLRLRCRGVYEITIPARALAGQTVSSIRDVPLPVARAGQPFVTLDRPTPPDRLSRGHEGDCCLSYSFTCDVEELAGPHQEAMPDDVVDRRRHLASAFPARLLPRARALLTTIGVASSHDPERAARRIYDWLLDHTWCLSAAQDDGALLERGFGGCIDVSRAFVGLCRLLNIPARERCGALFLRPLASTLAGQRVETCTRRVSPFSHTWAECHLAGRGWLPVEFVGGTFGHRVMTPANVLDPALRAQMVRDTPAYDAYYFGRLDPFRIHADDTANQRTVTPLLAGAPPRTVTPDLLDRIQHRLTVTFNIVSSRTVSEAEPDVAAVAANAASGTAAHAGPH